MFGIFHIYGVMLLSLIHHSSEKLRGPTLCSYDETVIFECAINKKVVSICALNALKSNGKIKAHYRFGQPNSIELQYPKDKENGQIFLSNVGYSGGGETHLSFVSGDYEYIVYDSTIRTNFSKNGGNNPEMESGIAVLKSGKLISRTACNEASNGIDSSAFKTFPRQKFKPIN